MRNELDADLDEHDYAKHPLNEAELKSLFDDAGQDPRDFLNPRSPAYKQLNLAGKKLSASDAIKLMVRDANLIKRPILIAGKNVVAGFDRDQMRAALKTAR